MKPVLFLFCALLAVTPAFAAPGAYTGPKDQLHVYLLIGQSNMSGRAPIAAGDDGHIDRCYLLDDAGQWVPSAHPFNRYSTIRKGLGIQKLNPGPSFARTMLAAQPAVSLGLIVNAKGGSNINEWQKGKKFFNEAVRRARQAQETGTLAGILWHQGESNEKSADGYLDKLAQLVADLRAELAAPNLPFVAGQVNKLPVVNDQIARLPGVVAHSAFVSSDGLTTLDRWHFDTASQTTLGERYAREMLKLRKNQR